MPRRFPIAAATATCMVCIASCALPNPNSPVIQSKLKLLSAGHTGCLPEANVITNMVFSSNGDGQWNVTCKGKTYLCTTIGTAGLAQPYSCAPVVQ
jgi:hypothetical protein